MDEKELNAFYTAIDMYTDLLFNEKEILFRIIETAYTRGYEAAQRDVVALQQRMDQERQQQQNLAEEKIKPPRR